MGKKPLVESLHEMLIMKLNLSLNLIRTRGQLNSNELVHYLFADITAKEYLDSASDLCTHLTIDPEQMSNEGWREKLRYEALEICRNEYLYEEEAERVMKMRFWK